MRKARIKAQNAQDCSGERRAARTLTFKGHMLKGHLRSP